MVIRKERVPVVLDTNVFYRAISTPNCASPNLRVMRLWLVERQLQLIVAPAIIDEYLRVFTDYLWMDKDRLPRHK